MAIAVAAVREDRTVMCVGLRMSSAGSATPLIERPRACLTTTRGAWVAPRRNGGGGGAVSGLAAAAQCHPLAPEKQATCAWLDLQPTLGRESKSASSVAASKSHR